MKIGMQVKELCGMKDDFSEMFSEKDEIMTIFEFLCSN